MLLVFHGSRRSGSKRLPLSTHFSVGQQLITGYRLEIGCSGGTFKQFPLADYEMLSLKQEITYFLSVPSLRKFGEARSGVWMARVLLIIGLLCYSDWRQVCETIYQPSSCTIASKQQSMQYGLRGTNAELEKLHNMLLDFSSFWISWLIESLS